MRDRGMTSLLYAETKKLSALGTDYLMTRDMWISLEGMKESSYMIQIWPLILLPSKYRVRALFPIS